MKRTLAIIIAIAATTIGWAQSPEAISYQAIIRDSNDQLVTNSSIGVQISILQGVDAGTATAIYVERQFPTTNANGLVSIQIGGSDATVISGEFSEIDWSAETYFIKTETDINGGSSYTITGTSQLLSVPYALFAKDVANKDDADADPNNEIQDISVSGKDLSISQGSTITLNVDDADSDSTNEIQVLSISNDSIFLSNGGSVKIPDGVNSWARSNAPGSLRQEDIQGKFGAVIPLLQGTLNDYGPSSTRSMQKVKFDSQGNICFAATYTGSISVGSNTFSSTSGIIFTKFNIQGDLLWAHSFSNDNKCSVYDIEIDSQDNILIIGEADGTLAIGSFSAINGYFVTKFNSAGELIWGLNAAFGAAKSYSIGIDDYDNIYLAYNYSSTNGAINKYDSNGTHVGSVYNYTNLSISKVTDIQFNADTLYLAGSWKSSSYQYPLLMKIPLDGSASKSYNYNELIVPYSRGECSSISFDEENNIYVGGFDTGSNPYAFIAKHDNNLKKVWLNNEKGKNEYLSTLYNGNLLAGYNYKEDGYLSTDVYLDNFTKNGGKSPVLFKYNTEGDLIDLYEMKSFYGLSGFQILEYDEEIYLFLNSYEGSFMNNDQKYEQGAYLLKL